MSVAVGGGVFVSYRREDSGYAAGRLRDRLNDRFGSERVFMDVETIEPGMDYVEAVTRAVETCDVLVAVIGPGWLSAADKLGRRLDDPYDWVRVEVGTALTRGVRVIPVLVGGAVMPGRGDLPEDLAGLGRRNALPVRHESFRDDAARLIAAVERVLASPAEGGAEGAPPTGDGPGGATDKGTRGSRGNLTRAIRLFEEAARVANTIADEYWKAVTLSGVASGMVAADPDRAARLFSSAERIAYSIDNETVIEKVLGDMASAAAATDPDRAEHIANTLPNAASKAEVRADVAIAVAATDPDRAERIANTIIYPTSKAEVLADVAIAVAATDPDRAARLFSEAEAAANSTHDGELKQRALSRVASAAAATDPDRAARLFSEAERAAKATNNALVEARTLANIASAAAATDPDRAARLFSEAERAAKSNSIIDVYWKAEALQSVVRPMAGINPDRAEHIANSITVSTTSKDLKELALSHVASAVAATDPDRAEHIANSINGVFRMEEALSGVAIAVAATDPDRAEHIANSLTGQARRKDTSWKEETLSGVARAVAATDPDRAERIANSLTDETLKAATLAIIAKALANEEGCAHGAADLRYGA
jgi:capsular polysaccharide biosynthesis protein